LYEVAFLLQLEVVMLKLWLDCDGQSLIADLECLPVAVGLIVLDSK
jgi:hypothetical protein